MSQATSQTVKWAFVAAGALAAVWPTYEFALVQSVRSANPELALSHSPGDGVALSKLVNRKIEKEGEYAASAEDTRIALRSLVLTPLSRSSLRIIGMNADLTGDSARAATAMKLSDRVSRRDAFAQVWLLEKAAAQNDFDAVLLHYHAALAVTPGLGEVLRPILVSAVQFPEIRAAIMPYLRSNASWTPGFLAQASNDASTTDLLDMISPVARWLSDEEYEEGISRLVYRLAADGEWSEAMSLAQSTWGDFDVEKFETPSTSTVTTDERLGRLAWSLTRSGGINARVNQDGFLDVSMDPLSRGTVVNRSLPVKGAGEYTFTQRVKFTGGGERARINWRADCISSAERPSERVWDQAIPTRAEATTYRSTINLPADCNLLTLTLSGTGPESQPPSNFSITQMEFARSVR